ncbi:hypothetical protein AAHC03_0285 [Spirometra sp. Aus1]
MHPATAVFSLLRAYEFTFSKVTRFLLQESRGEGKEGASPSSTPTQSRKTRPKSNIFRKGDDPREKEKKVDGIGSGRSIPLKQGFLYKRTCKPLNKEWKTKKYVALTEDARLIYHPSIQDYVQNSHGKEIDLSRVTVKIPGLAFRQAGGQTTANGPNRSQTADAVNSDKFASSAEHTTANSEPGQTSNENSVASGNRVPQQSTKDSVKKRYRRVKSSQKSGATDGYESEGYEFQLISMDRQWHFEASNLEDRDEWVAHIDRAILTRLQLLESSKRGTARGALSGASGASPATSGDLAGLAGSGGGGGGGGHNWTTHSTSGSDPGGLKGSGEKMGESVRVDEVTVKALQSVAGNDCCADCGAAGKPLIPPPSVFVVFAPPFPHLGYRHHVRSSPPPPPSFLFIIFPMHIPVPERGSCYLLLHVPTSVVHISRS